MAQGTKLLDLSPTPAYGVPSSPKNAALLEESLQPAGPRKLVRPRLPENLAGRLAAPRRLRGAAPLAQHEGRAALGRASTAAGRHAEALYFQKQIQPQPLLVFVLEDGERIEGVLEWFDQHSLKVRNSTRQLIFKRCIKYLHKVVDSE